jgi:predicted short-subunit dehydrogenase-like oxidoreductase (DUF2520 family)
MQESYNIALIGAGNLAWHLGPAFENCGHRISLVYNRNRKNANRLMERLYQAELKRNLNFSNDPVDLIIMAVTDSVIQEIVSEIVLPEDCQLIHTSGCQPLGILEKSAAAHFGVLYPLQTFSKGTTLDFRETPVFLESSSESGMEQLIRLAKGLSKKIYQINSTQRRTIHLAAVISTNFSNHLFTIAKKLLEEKHIDFDLLQPIAYTMIQKVFTLGPEAGQTGPAVRGDLETMDLHMELLERRKDLMEIYSMMSKHIFETCKKAKRR